jgi:hypothetical protein
LKIARHIAAYAILSMNLSIQSVTLIP